MSKTKPVSDVLIRRLPRYYRYIEEMYKCKVPKVSSLTLANIMNITASQVRQDFCSFGEFGQQGYGYDVKFLYEQLKEILGLGKAYNLIVVGAGNIGRALANYKGFNEEGFRVQALFDKYPSAKTLNGTPVYSIDELNAYTQSNRTDIAIIATPKENAREVAEIILSAGIKTIWNFAPLDLELEGATVENINLSDSLYVLCYKVKNRIDTAE
ncbi:MAG: redox-sensing transcriptional repressor Rex [Christensenellales bacterium]